MENKKLSGAEYRKRRKIQDADNKKQSGQLLKLFSNAQPLATSSEIFNENIIAPQIDCTSSLNIVEHEINVQHQDNALDMALSLDLEDPNNWPPLSNNIISKIVITGPKQIFDFKFPKTNNRKFSISSYKRILANGDQISRSWLVYSISKNSVYCFCCLLFSKNKNISALSSFGCSDWTHISQICKSHENSSLHMDSFKSWKDLKAGLNNNQTIDFGLENLMKAEVTHWKNVLRRLITVVKILSTQSLAFRGSSEKLFELNNGNFLKLVEAIGTFDAVLGEHLKRITNQETQNMYLSKNIQNEIITLLSNLVKNKILNMIQTAKHFSIIVDSTPDKSRVEQVTLIIRFVHYHNNIFQIKEHFLGFLEGNEKTGEALTDLVLRELNNLNLSLSNCRGQGYDNGSNMHGKQSGMQNRIRILEPRAFFVPCCSHSLNLVVNDSANCSLDAVKFFGIVQNLYVFVSSSTTRWHIYKKNVPNLTLKPLSETRWESRIDALKPLKNNLGDIYEALIEISEDGNSDIKVTAESLGNKILDFKFICILLVWYDILEKINIASKYLQGQRINLSAGIEILENTKKNLVSMRTDDIFNAYICEAERIASKLEIASHFSNPSLLRSRRNKSNTETILDPKHSFRVNFYYKVLDQATSSINERFELLKSHNNTFSFLHHISEASIVPTLKYSCRKLEEVLRFER